MKKNMEDVFDKQLELNLRVMPDFQEKIDTPDERRQLFLQFELALRQESCEAIDSLSWKWWKKMDDDWDNLKIELVDMLHFWVSMCLVAKMTPDDVFDLYFKKNELNHKRQDQGYKEGTYQKVVDGVEDNKTIL
jgi:dimeric dUTPase (all-alpha-NTP-PPase superfamily)